MSESEQTGRRALVGGIVLVAIVVRVGLAFAVPVEVLDGDAIQYEEIGWSLAQGQGFSFLGEPTGLRPPAYPGFLAAVYTVAGRSRIAVRLAQAVLDGGTALVTYTLGAHLFGPGVGLVAAGVIALHPGMAYASTGMLSESLFTLLFVSAVYLFVIGQTAERGRWSAAAGVAWGLAALCRPTALLVPFTWLLASVAGEHRWRRFRRTAIVCAVMVGCIAPWTVRNRVVLGDWAAISTSSLGHALWYGSYPDWDLEWRGWDEPPLDTLLAGLDEARDPVEIEDVLLRDALQNIREHPGTYVVFGVRKAWKLWRPTPGTVDQAMGSAPLMLALRGYHVALVVLFAVGLFRPNFGVPRDFWVLLLMMYWTGIHAATIAVPRYLLPLVPVLAIYASRGGRHLARLFRSRSMESEMHQDVVGGVQ